MLNCRSDYSSKSRVVLCQTKVPHLDGAPIFAYRDFSEKRQSASKRSYLRPGQAVQDFMCIILQLEIKKKNL